MRRPALFSTPPLIAIADEPLGGGAALTAAETLLSSDGFEIVPAWQAHPPRRLRRLSAAVPLVAVAAAAALWVGRDDGARALRERPASAVASETARAPALVVSAAPAGRAGSRRSGR
ncbi:MAG: hypothetical protein ACRDGE_12320 [Candidatus Limnocylindria bacterium]